MPELVDSVILNVGDIIIVYVNNSVGLLIRKEHHIDIEADDVYFWEVKWNNADDPRLNFLHFTFLEEDSLRFSILIGTYEWHSVKGEEIDL